MKNLTPLFVIFIFALYGTFVECQNNYCNSGSCESTSDCSLGSCCNGTCIKDVAVLPRDSSCDLSGCSKCSPGQVCNGTSLLCENAYGSVKKSNGCDCVENNECASNFCNPTTKMCASLNLFPNDECQSDRQCAGTQKCQNSLCANPIDGQACINEYCGYGHYCDQSNSTAGPVCRPKSKIGQECTSLGCFDFGASCVGGTCIELFSVPEGKTCGSSNNCMVGLRCSDNVCVKSDSQTCSCGNYQTCGCSGNSSICTIPPRSCRDQNRAYISCMRRHQCSSASKLESCGLKNCNNEILSSYCCQSCENADRSDLVWVNLGLDCSTLTLNEPKICDGQISVSMFGKCGVTNGTTLPSTSETESKTDFVVSEAIILSQYLTLIIAIFYVLSTI